ncbi:MAG: metallo-mystery pair system four-Cys motif protein [Thermoleophilia bacterium]|nr:metallo-mystery pair system four-Cys motif protein [Thermoleophilia bacterium]
MTTRTTRRSALALAAAGLAAFGAQGAAAHQNMTVTIPFTAVNGTAPVSCGTAITGLGTTAATAQLKDLRFYVSNVRMVRGDGSSVLLKLTPKKGSVVSRGGNRVTMIDLENGTGSCDQGDAAVNSVIRGTVPHATYVGMRFYMGVPFPLNHSDTVGAPAPLDLTAMTWSWQAGRKFAKIELTDPAGPAGTWTAKTFMVHLGSTGCLGNPATGGTANCIASNRMTVRFAKFDPAKQKVAVDIGALAAGNDVTVNRGGAAGCMSGGTDPECGPVFTALGVDWKADGTGTGASSGTQTLFRAMAR